MKMIFLAVLTAMAVILPNFCAAATIETAYFNGNEKRAYPVVHLANSEAEKKINTAIIAEIDRFLTGVYRNAQKNSLEVVYADTNYQVHCNEDGGTVILSISVTEKAYFKMAAHGSTYFHTLNFNVTNGELIDTSYLTDIGGGNPKFSLENVSRKLKEHAERKNLYLFPDALPLKKLPKNFYWDKDLHVHLVFQHYEVAPYAYGIIDLDMDS